MAWSALTHRLKSDWKELPLRGGRFLVLLSGGADSVALFSVLQELREPLGFEISAGHIHHGPGPYLQARNRAQAFCGELCLEWKIPFFTATAGEELRSEAALRDFRRARALEWKEAGGFDRLVVGHHARDLLETRFFRLLRGTGGRGLAAMRPWVAPWWRPLLEVEPEELRAHLKWHRIPYLEDPSNRHVSWHRNWLRQEFFPALEKKRPGSLRKMSESLTHIAQELENAVSPREAGSTGLSRAWFLTLNRTEKKRALAQYLWGLGQRHFRHTQLEEICKRLDISQSEHRFSLAGCEWLLNAEQIIAFPKGKKTQQIEA